MAMDFNKYKQINDERLNYREMEDATVVSSYRNLGCGDGYRLYLKIDESSPEKRIIEASYTTTGCGFGLTALAMATEWVRGRSLAEAAAITAADIEGLFEFPERRKNYPDSAVEAMRKAVADYQNGTGVDPEDRVSRAATLELLKSQGHLRGVKLNQVILDGEDLHGVDFSGADLGNAFLTGCNFEGAIFRGSRLRGAFLNSSNLKDADFRGADLRWTKLTAAKIEGARFEEALYDIGTRVDAGQTRIFEVMVQAGKELYVKN